MADRGLDTQVIDGRTQRDVACPRVRSAIKAKHRVSETSAYGMLIRAAVAA